MSNNSKIISHSCPCCGGFMGDAAPLEFVKDLAVGRVQMKVLDILIQRKLRPVQMVDIINHCYADDPNGGPEDAANCISIAVFKLRKSLKSAGWYIHKRGGGGVGTSGGAFYRLIPSEVWT